MEVQLLTVIILHALQAHNVYSVLTYLSILQVSELSMAHQQYKGRSVL